jgi:glycosyltransferase involved in cell wall biosynthesis
MPEVRRRIPDAHLLLVGDGPTREALAELARTLHLTSCVHFAGYQSAPQRYLEAMDLFVLPSRLEGMPLAILEAWAARLPVVATRVGGVPNLVSEGETGLLVHSGDWKDLAENIIMVLSDKSLARRLGEGGRARVEVDFSSRGMAARYNQLYLEALKSR